jgi:recombination protein RecR
MNNDTLTTLTELLKKLPGIGPRQARRLAFWFVRRDATWIDTFAKTLIEARQKITVCEVCKRLYSAGGTVSMCSICSSEARDATTLMLVEKDVDLENIEKTGAYRGRYYVLGGTTSPLDKEPEKKIRIENLLTLLSNKTKKQPIKEIIYALSATTEGEDTILFLDEKLRLLVEQNGITLTKLGRGLSTGTELEYVDKDTMAHALESRN